ncbi:alpha/beta hydrolase [Colwelliaceae bacterium 6441]
MKTLIQGIISSVILIVICTPTIANELLPQSAFLGLAPVSAENENNVVIRALHPAGTGQALGLAIGDSLVSVNQQPTKDFSTLLEQLKHIHTGDQLKVKVIRNKQTLELSAKAIGKPKEKGNGFTVDYSAFEWQQERIRTISYDPNKPRKDGAAVFFIQGYTCDSIDYGMHPNLSINQLLGSFAQAGFSVFKMEKPGVGESKGQLSCDQYDFLVENDAFKAGIAHFKQQKGVNPDNLFVFGHSLGVLHAALIAEQGSAKGVIGYGGVLKSWHDYLQDIYTKQSVKYWGISKEQASRNSALLSPLLHDWLKTNKPWQQVVDSNKQAINSNLINVNAEQVFDRHYSFFHSVNQLPFKQLWQQSKSHTLMLHGTYDIQAIEEDWAKQITQLVNENTTLTAEYKIFDRTDHSLMIFNNKTDLLKATSREVNDLGTFNEDIPEVALRWMQQHLTPKATK